MLIEPISVETAGESMEAKFRRFLFHDAAMQKEPELKVISSYN